MSVALEAGRWTKPGQHKRKRMPGRISRSRPAVARSFGGRCCSRPSRSGNRPADAKADGSGPKLASRRPEPDRGGLARFRPGRRKRASARSSRRRRIGACFDPSIARRNQGACSEGEAKRVKIRASARSPFAAEDRGSLRSKPKGGGSEACFGPRPSGWRSGFAPGSTFAAEDRGSPRPDAERLRI